jgi:hypothetical protein
MDDWPMTKHVPRRARWSQLGPNEHRCAEGRVFYCAGQWFAEIAYRVGELGSPAGTTEPLCWQAGRFKRPRNAMIALEERATALRRQHGENLAFLDSRVAT